MSDVDYFVAESALVYREFLDAILTLPLEDAGRACIAYFDYAFNGNMYSGDNVVISALMAMCKARIDADKDELINIAHQFAEIERDSGCAILKFCDRKDRD